MGDGFSYYLDKAASINNLIDLILSVYGRFSQVAFINVPICEMHRFEHNISIKIKP